MYTVFRKGSKRRLCWGSDGSGKYRGRDYYEGLDEKNQLAFDPWFQRILEGIRIKSPEKFRHEGDQLYVFKNYQYRLACFFDGRDVVIIDGFTKKDDKSRKVDRCIKTAKRLRDEYLERKRRSS